MKKIISALALSTVAISAQAEITNVFCAASNGEYWYWGKDTYGNALQVSGKWGRAKVEKMSDFQYFSISEEDYNRVRGYCRNGETAQPANNQFSKWYIFQVKKNDGSQYFAPGRYTTLVDLNSSFMLRV
ncbi:hypothetical protein [Chromobacterium amazonense]|uniref:hypothetical protein n=1 Tax=Chromobacterium amazonense TaxID=1382803 RepID=UPI0011B1D188|nr:hypothetical protein [Chromobacterium amazonense]